MVTEAVYRLENTEEGEDKLIVNYFGTLMLTLFWLTYASHLQTSLLIKTIFQLGSLVVFYVLSYTWLDHMTSKIKN